MKGAKGYQLGHETSILTRKKIGDALRKPVYFNKEEGIAMNCSHPWVSESFWSGRHFFYRCIRCGREWI